MENIILSDKIEKHEKNKYFINEVLPQKVMKSNKIKYLTFIILLYFIVSKFANQTYFFKPNKLHKEFNVPFNNEYIPDNKFYNTLINKYKRKSTIKNLSKSIKFKPWMSKKEIKAFLSLMKPGNIYFEFGSGGSTNIASHYKLKTYSVESDVKWHEKLKRSGIIANYITIDLKSNLIGYPGKDTNENDWKRYIQAYKKEYNADIILIDGRFRVACALDLFSKIRNDTIILIHDYKPRKSYHVLEKFYIKIKSWDTLSLFVKNPKIDTIPINIYNFYLKEKLI